MPWMSSKETGINCLFPQTHDFFHWINVYLIWFYFRFQAWFNFQCIHHLLCSRMIQQESRTQIQNLYQQNFQFACYTTNNLITVQFVSIIRKYRVTRFLFSKWKKAETSENCSFSHLISLDRNSIRWRCWNQENLFWLL